MAASKIILHDVYSFRLFLERLFQSTTTQRRSRLQQLTLCQSFTQKGHRQLRVKDLPRVPMWRLEWDSNWRSSGWKAPNLLMSHHALRYTPSFWTQAETLLIWQQLAKVDLGSLTWKYLHPNLLPFRPRSESNSDAYICPIYFGPSNWIGFPLALG